METKLAIRAGFVPEKSDACSIDYSYSMRFLNSIRMIGKAHIKKKNRKCDHRLANRLGTRREEGGEGCGALAGEPPETLGGSNPDALKVNLLQKT
jgi:hypothetical protein